MAKYTFQAGKRPEDAVERLVFQGNTYQMHYRRLSPTKTESVEQCFFAQVPNFYQLPKKVQEALVKLSEDHGRFALAQAVQVLSDYEREASHGTA